MANIISALNEHVRKLARREVRAETSRTTRSGAQYRRDIAELKRTIKALGSRVNHLEKRGGAVHMATGKRGGAVSGGGGEAPDNARFRKDGLKSHRTRLGISARDYGRLVGVSSLTIYNWEAGKSKPRARQLAGIIAVRGMGKREVDRRLQELDAE